MLIRPLATNAQTANVQPNSVIGTRPDCIIGYEFEQLVLSNPFNPLIVVALLFVAVERLIAAEGIDPTTAAVESARARGVRAARGDLTDVALEEGAFDAITFRLVFERIPEGGDGVNQNGVPG